MCSRIFVPACAVLVLFASCKSAATRPVADASSDGSIDGAAVETGDGVDGGRTELGAPSGSDASGLTRTDGKPDAPYGTSIDAPAPNDDAATQGVDSGLPRLADGSEPARPDSRSDSPDSNNLDTAYQIPGSDGGVGGIGLDSGSSQLADASRQPGIDGRPDSPDGATPDTPYQSPIPSGGGGPTENENSRRDALVSDGDSSTDVGAEFDGDAPASNASDAESPGLDGASAHVTIDPSIVRAIRLVSEALSTYRAATASEVAAAWISTDGLESLDAHWKALINGGVVAASTFRFDSTTGGYFTTEDGPVGLFVARNDVEDQDGQVVRLIWGGQSATWIEYWAPTDPGPDYTLAFATPQGIATIAIGDLVALQGSQPSASGNHSHAGASCDKTVADVCAWPASVGAALPCAIVAAPVVYTVVGAACLALTGPAVPLCVAAVVGGAGFMCAKSAGVVDDLKVYESACRESVGCMLNLRAGLDDCSCSLPEVAETCTGLVGKLTDGLICHYLGRRLPSIPTSKNYRMPLTNYLCRKLGMAGSRGPLGKPGELCAYAVETLCTKVLQKATRPVVESTCACLMGAIDETMLNGCWLCGSGSSGCGVAGSPTPPPHSGGLWGDPHLFTFDGVKYDCQVVGETTMVLADDGLEVQARTAALGAGQVSLTVATAVRIGTDRVAFYAGKDAVLNGSETQFTEGKTVLPGNGEVYHYGNKYILVWPDNSQVHVTAYSDHLDVTVFLADARQQQVVGLLGNFDGATAGEFVTRQGAVLPEPLTFEDFYQTYVESWRVTQQGSLFDYAQGQDTAYFTNRNFPSQVAAASGLSESDRAEATTICQQAGVSQDWMDACILDVGTTGDPSFVGSAVFAPVPAVTVEVPAPSTGPCANLSADVANWWKGNGDALDVTGKNNGMFGGTTTYSTGVSDQAFDFDGSVDTGVSTGLIDLSHKSFSFSAWVKRRTIGTHDFLFGQGTTTNSMGLHIGYRAENTFTFAFYADDLNTPLAYTDLNWHHWAGTFDAASRSRTLYRDGVLVASNAASDDYKGTGNFRIGTAAWQGSEMDGLIDEPMIFARVLTPSEVESIFNAGGASLCASK